MGRTQRWPIAGVLVAASLAAASGAVAAEPMPGASPSEWTIRPRGLGRLDLERTVTVGKAREVYPDAKVELRSGRYDFSIGEQLAYVLVEGGKELFASVCFCELDANGTPRSKLKEIREPDDMWLHPITTDPRFRTDRGIGVGSTVRELVKAYPELPRLVYHQEGASDSELPAAEWVCLLRKGATRGRVDTLENVRFYVRLPGKKIAAGQPREGKLKKQRVDLRAEIVAVEPDQACTRDYPPGGD